jgi:hypothetical protein
MKFLAVNSSHTSAFPTSSSSSIASSLDDALTAEKSPFCHRQMNSGICHAPAAIKGCSTLPALKLSALATYCCNIFFALGSRPTVDPERFVSTTHKFIVFPCAIRRIVTL